MSEISTTRKPPTLPPFLTLPPELRLQVYSHLLLRRYIFFSTQVDPQCDKSHFFANHASVASPSLSIMRVCRIVHTEAEHLYASQNIFVLPTTWEFQLHEGRFKRPLMSLRAWGWVRNLRLSFSTGPLRCGTTLPDLQFDLVQIHRQSPQQVLRASNLKDIRDLPKTFVFNTCVSYIRKLAILLPPRSLNTLGLEFSGPFFTSGYHRLTTELAENVGLLRLPSVVEVYGCLGELEKRTFGATLQKTLWHTNQRHCIHFIPPRSRTKTSKPLQRYYARYNAARNQPSGYRATGEGAAGKFSVWRQEGKLYDDPSAAAYSTPACWYHHLREEMLNSETRGWPWDASGLEAVYLPDEGELMDV